ncbi:proton-conducting transporter membrane subunit [Amycolatopsis jejuensis]|uniref:proton-conducting transporter transmembrane domain-containing protein n=1 Tax=Amycolatopsis jejuensis TaxID=330084 RepID=UPI000ABB2C98|nr:proton-conducting transporter membrane subunit [Amycolatopsis jejuensis]
MSEPINLAAVGLGAAVALGLLTALLAILLPARQRTIAAGIGTVLAGAAGAVAGGAALAGQTAQVSLPWLLPLSGIHLGLDRMGGLFIAVTGGVAVAAGVYGAGYLRHGLRARTVQAVQPLFVVAMLLVPAASSVGTFLACWELMAVTSLILLLAEHRERPAVASAGRWYAVMTHLGFVTVLIGLLWFADQAGGDSFAALRNASLPSGAASGIFLLTLAGFASKAGIVPLHAWLPRAHPEAPSHVSALMSAAMVNLGAYGVLRVGVDLLGGGPGWWWTVVLVLGALSAVYGILQAAMTSDLKRLLGYSTTENLGLVFAGIGAAGLLEAAGARVPAGLALAAALLHVVGHAAFKTLLFLAAGSVVRATGTGDLDALGGLRTRMPWTTGMFGLGALAASALPPGTAFVSEWLLLQALVHGLPSAAVTMPLTVAAIALTAGLAVATFVKAFGIGFLAKPRGPGAERAIESPLTMRVGMGIAALACLVPALVPALVLPAITTGDPVARDLIAVRLNGVTGMVSPLLITAGLLGAAVLVVAGVRLLATRRERREARLWDCGGGPSTARMEYTATSFAEPLQRVFDNVVRPETDVDVGHYDEARYLVRQVAYRREVPDRIERLLYQPVLTAAAAWGRAGRKLATGSVHRYLGYGFSAVVFAFVVLAVTR